MATKKHIISIQHINVNINIIICKKISKNISICNHAILTGNSPKNMGEPHEPADQYPLNINSNVFVVCDK